MVSTTIVGVRRTTLDEFPYFYSFICLFFFQKALLHLASESVVLFRDSLLPRPENGPEPRKRESPVLLAGACSERRHFFPQNWGENRIWKEIPNLGIAYSPYFYTENMAGDLKGNHMMPSFSKQLVSHLRNASLTLCPRRSKFRLSTQSLPMCSNRIWQVCLLRCSSFCL